MGGVSRWDAFFGGRYGAVDDYLKNKIVTYFDVRDVTAGNVKTSTDINIFFFCVAESLL